jgi:hypothetical protein
MADSRRETPENVGSEGKVVTVDSKEPRKCDRAGVSTPGTFFCSEHGEDFILEFVGFYF